MLVVFGLACESGQGPKPRRVLEPAPPAPTAAEAVSNASSPPSPSATVKWHPRPPDASSLPRPLSEVTVPRPANRPGSACGKDRSVKLHGFIGDEPVNATLLLLPERTSLEVVSMTSGTTTKYQGRWEGNVC